MQNVHCLEKEQMLVHPLAQDLTQNSLKTKANNSYMSILNHQGEQDKAFLLRIVKTLFTEPWKGQK